MASHLDGSDLHVCRGGSNTGGGSTLSEHRPRKARERPAMPEKAKRFLVQFTQAAGVQDPQAAVMTFMNRSSIARAWGEFRQTHPLIVAPIFTELPFAAGSDIDDGAVARTIRGMRMATAINALGLPAVAVPVGVADGLPQVVQIMGPATEKTSASTPPPRSKTLSASSHRSTHGNPSKIVALIPGSARTNILIWPPIGRYEASPG
jgi:hypothetical protein